MSTRAGLRGAGNFRWAALIELEHWAAGTDTLYEAEAAAKAALEELKEKDEGNHWAICHFNLGKVYRYLGERKNNKDMLQRSLLELEDALTAFDASKFDGAALETRGEMLLVRKSIDELAG